ncbi:hypothetical protein B0H94_10276 [Salsuginibacillus halophilus]|uniref:Amine oxidase domain-containing protein n=1 Tax=Salsuginibacillus halophilus TaxID=517424 RepID=A0A2P8HX57_9BACI|nr:FAD-dependent oxidoreductase [Salsuginibacillus halophilus]PSL50800.1 hypothetical protein B0H94_10276 [Salsuginibacillus halophilus]
MINADTIIIGAGLAGWSAYQEMRSDKKVLVFDKAKSPGGRMATRRIFDGQADHGAQFFTARSSWMKAWVEEQVKSGRVEEWCRGFWQAAHAERFEEDMTLNADGYPRYRAVDGMAPLLKYLWQDCDMLYTGFELVNVQEESGCWHLSFETQNGELETVSAANVLFTMPLPQAKRLFEASGLQGLSQAASGRAFSPCLALIAAADEPALKAPAGLQFHEGPLQFIADNKLKGVSATHVVTVHGSESFSKAWFDVDDDEVKVKMHELASPWLDTVLRESVVKRWRYAKPINPAGEGSVLHTTKTGATAAFAGDAFFNGKVEGALLSGKEAAERLHTI